MCHSRKKEVTNGKSCGIIQHPHCQWRAPDSAGYGTGSSGHTRAAQRKVQPAVSVRRIFPNHARRGTTTRPQPAVSVKTIHARNNGKSAATENTTNLSKLPIPFTLKNQPAVHSGKYNNCARLTGCLLPITSKLI